jgi:glycosyltransferase involved in cell wall biosynthesis
VFHRIIVAPMISAWTAETAMTPRPLILIDTSIIGGPGRGIIQLAGYLKERDLDCVICSFSYQTGKSHEFQDELERLGLCSAKIAQASVFDPRPIYDFLRLARRGRFNIIQSHGYKSHFVALVVTRILHLPWIAFAHGWTSEDRKVAVYHALDKCMLRVAESVVAVSPQLHQFFSEVRGPARRTLEIQNAVDPNLIRGSEGGAIIRKRFCSESGAVFLGCFGRLSYEKGHDLLLDALPIVLRKHPNIFLLCLGDGPQREVLQKQCERLGLSAKVHFQPHTSAIRDYYEAIDLLVVPSRSEGLPNVVLEALALGVPVVSTDVGAISGVLSDGETGWIVQSGSVDGLADALLDVLASECERKARARAGMAFVKKSFGPNARAEKIVSEYVAVLKEHAPR